MASLILLAVLTMYCIWSLRRIIKHAKKIAESVPVALIKAGCASKALTKPVQLSMMKIQLNNDLIVLTTGEN